MIKKRRRTLCRIAGLALGLVFLFGNGGGVTVLGSEKQESAITALESEIRGMELGGYVGENLEGNVTNWQIDAYRNNSNIVQQIALANSGKTSLDMLLGTDYYGVDEYFNIDVADASGSLTEDYFGAVLSYAPRKANAYYGDAGYRLDKDILSGVTDWTGAEEIWLYVDARESDAENIKIRLNFEEGDYADGTPTGINEAYSLVRDSKVKLVDGETGEVSETSVVLDSALNDNFVVLDKNFYGFVCFTLDLEHFWRYYNSADGANGVLDLKDVHQLTLAVGGADEASVGDPIYFAFGIVGAFSEGQEVPFSLKEDKKFRNALPFTTDVFIPDITDGAWVGDLYSDWDVIVTRGQKSRSGNALGWTLKQTSSSYSDRDIRFSNDPQAVTDWTGAKELWVYLDASEIAAETQVRFAFEENAVGRASYSLKEGASVKLHKNGEDVTRMRTVQADGGGYIPLPAEFAGYIRMPLDENTFAKYWGENDNDRLEISNVVQFQLSVRGSDAMVGKTVYMDSFAVVGEMEGEPLPVKTDLDPADTYKEIWTLEGLEKRTGASGNIVIWYGEFAGKLLTGMAYGYKATLNPELKEAGDELVADLAAAQGEDGYLGTYMGGARFAIESNNWDLWNHYHCITGLLEWYEITGNQTAFDVAKKAIDCIYETFKDRSYLVAGGFETNRGIAHGYAQMYQATGDKKYLDEAERIIMQDCQDENGWYKTALRLGNFYQSSSARWEVLHMIMTLGILYEETGNEEYYLVMGWIWNNILQTDIHNTGGFTTNEGACGDPYRTGVIETCCTIAWMAFTNEYYKYTKTVEVADELERSYLNGMLGSLLDEDKYCTYNSPMNGVAGTAGGYDGRKVPSQQDISFQYNSGSPDFNCCQANLARGLGQLVEWAAVTDGNELYLNYYGESNIHTKVGGADVSLKQTTLYPLNGSVKIEIGGLQSEKEFTLKLRIPGWAVGSKVSVNGQTVYGIEAGEYASLTRTWKNGDVIQLDIAMQVRYWTGEDSMEGYASVYYGPVLMALDRSFASIYNQNTVFLEEDIDGAAVIDGSSVGAMLLMEVPVGGTSVMLVDYASAGKYNGEAEPSTYWTWLKVEGAPASDALGEKPIWQNTPKQEVSFGEYIEFERAMYRPGETVRFTVAVPEGYAVQEIAVTEGLAVAENNGEYSFTMPQTPVDVSVSFKEAESEEPADNPQDSDEEQDPSAPSGPDEPGGGCSGTVGYAGAGFALISAGAAVGLMVKKRKKIK